MNNENISVLSDSQLSDFFMDQLNEIFHSENKMFAAWPQLMEAADATDLKQLFQDYHSHIQKDIVRLEGIFALLNCSSDGRTADAMDGLLSEAKTVIEKTKQGSHTRDAAIIVAVQKAGHYKIAAYGSLQQIASTLGMEDISNLLSQCLQEEKDNDLLLSDFADKRINWLAEIEPRV
jgi:ferritin-like metal-binding protein YciE